MLPANGALGVPVRAALRGHRWQGACGALPQRGSRRLVAAVSPLVAAGLSTGRRGASVQSLAGTLTGDSGGLGYRPARTSFLHVIYTAVPACFTKLKTGGAYATEQGNIWTGAGD
jgi:hypothetical protein